MQFKGNAQTQDKILIAFQRVLFSCYELMNSSILQADVLCFCFVLSFFPLRSKMFRRLADQCVTHRANQTAYVEDAVENGLYDGLNVQFFKEELFAIIIAVHFYSSDLHYLLVYRILSVCLRACLTEEPRAVLASIICFLITALCADVDWQLPLSEWHLFEQLCLRVVMKMCTIFSVFFFYCFFPPMKQFYLIVSLKFQEFIYQ